jgi:hypothetical protein
VGLDTSSKANRSASRINRLPTPGASTAAGEESLTQLAVGSAAIASSFRSSRDGSCVLIANFGRVDSLKLERNRIDRFF